MAFTYDVIPFHTSNEHEQTSIITKKLLITCQNIASTYWQNQLDRQAVARDYSHRCSLLSRVSQYIVSGQTRTLKLKVETTSVTGQLTWIKTTHARIVGRAFTIAQVPSFTIKIWIIALRKIQYIFRQLYLSVTNFWQSFSSRCFAPYSVQYDQPG